MFGKGLKKSGAIISSRVRILMGLPSLTILRENGSDEGFIKPDLIVK